MEINREDKGEHIELKILSKEFSQKFEIVSILGKGGFGKVYKVKEKKTESVYALKVLDPSKIPESSDVDKKNVKERFIREAKILEQFEHPNIVNIFGTASEENYLYIIMEYIEGKDLNRYIKEKGKLSFKEVLEKSESILNALDYIHSKRLVHRDLKPQNIMIENGSERIVIIDFGIAKDLIAPDLTISEISIGTPHYMSPEQWKGIKGVDKKTDIYSYGVILFQMLSGVVPFNGNQAEIMQKHFLEPVPDVRKKNPLAPSGIQKIIKKAMEKNPKDRYNRAAELLNALNKLWENQTAESKPKPFKNLIIFFAIIVAATFIVFNPLGIGEKGINEDKQYQSHISAAKNYIKTGEIEKANTSLAAAKAIKDTPERKELFDQIAAIEEMKKDFQPLEALLKGDADKEKKLAECRKFLDDNKNTPENIETKSMVSRVNDYINQLEGDIRYKKNIADAEEYLKKGEFEQAYKSLRLTKEVNETPEKKELENKIFEGCIYAAKDYYKKANYPEAKKFLSIVKKIKSNRELQELEERIELLKEMPENVKSVLKKAEVEKGKKNSWEADFGDGIVMVYIPEGYWMGKTEVSIKQYLKFVNERGSNHPEWLKSGSDFHIKTGSDTYYKGFVENDLLPIVGISWENADAYCRWLSNKTGLTFKLPSEAQWEKAARGTDGRLYPWGSKKPDNTLANFSLPGGPTRNVDANPRGASPYGLLNMAGNVEEWCEDLFSPQDKNSRTARGGSFYDNENYIRCTSRRRYDAKERTNSLGFRLCMENK